MVIDISEPSTFVPVLGGIIIPFVVALLAKVDAALWIKSLIAFVSAGLIALGLYLTDDVADSWEGAVSVFLTAVVAAAASRVTITGGADTRLAAATQNFGIGRHEPQEIPHGEFTFDQAAAQ